MVRPRTAYFLGLLLKIINRKLIRNQQSAAYIPLAKSTLIFRYLVARENNESAAPVAFAHFRYDMDYDDEVLYVYEIQGLVAHKIDKITCSQQRVT